MARMLSETHQNRNKIIDLHQYSEYEDYVDQNLEDWDVTDISATQIDIKLKFKDPKQVSIGHERDLLTVEINLSEYED